MLSLQRIAGLAMERVPSWRELTVRLDPQAGRKPGPVQLTVRERDARPRFAAVQLWADPFTGKFLREERHGDLSRGRKARVWMRFLHTGEAFGAAGQLVAGLASIGAAVLVWTGLALALRRLARSLRARPAMGSEAEPSSP
ncbi:MAG TPA: PepSY domain-containing protein [Myxococcaceae bacterium]|nr:PepSY domain-containing protein [Myxococcaceae bacterium]